MHVNDPNTQRLQRWSDFSDALPLVAILVGLLLVSADALAIPKGNARIAVDAYTGEVLVARGSQTRWNPASLTKIMTLYQLFDALERGKVTMRTRIKLSRRASRQPPSKLGIGMGRTISVSDAIPALAVKSANDIAVAVGEHLAGSETKFARRMTATARRLGMSKTTFRNASGLHHPSQVTTARDMAILAVAMRRDFPQYYEYFGRKVFRYGRRVFGTHNRMLKSYSGMDGLKTGYIFKSGFNLAASVGRRDKRIVAVVLGANSSAQRSRIMASVLDQAFDRLADPRRKYITRKLPVRLISPPPLPRPRPHSTPPALLVAYQPPAPPVPSVLASGDRPPLPRPRGGSTTGRPLPAPSPASVSAVTFEVPPQPKQATLAAVRALERSTAVKRVNAGPKVGRYGVQIGAYRSFGEAERHLASVIRRLPNRLGEPDPQVAKFNHAKRGTYFRARLVGFGTRDAAARTCRWLKDRRTDCLIVAAKP